MLKNRYLNLIILTLGVVLILGLTACNSNVANSSTELSTDELEKAETELVFMSAEELKQQLESVGNSLYVLDVRYVDDYNKSHLEGAVNIPFSQVEERLGEIPADQKIAVVCYVGKSAQQISKDLNAAGFDSVVVTGGFGAIEEEGFDLVKTN